LENRKCYGENLKMGNHVLVNIAQHRSGSRGTSNNCVGKQNNEKE